jgi:hypothetical protein
MNLSSNSHLGVNLAFTKFIFVTPARDDDAARTRLRAAGAIVARGFFNDFEAEGRDGPPQETIQFLVNEDTRGSRDSPRRPVAPRRAPELRWRYVVEGPEWRGRRVLKW